MNDMTVGMENLPNVFIDKIIASSTSNPELIEVEVIIALYDHKYTPSWRNRAEFSLDLHVVFESRVEKIRQMNQGTLSLFDSQADMDSVSSIRSVSMGTNPVGTQGDYDKYTIKVRKIVRKTRNLNIYAACFVKNLGFGEHPVFGKFYGPMAAEQVYVEGRINTLSNYFYYPDTNEEYGGPVHLRPNGTYMEGSIHEEESHRKVQLVSEENYKIQAFDTILGPTDEVFAGSNIASNVSVQNAGVMTGVPANINNLGGSTTYFGTEVTPDGETVSDGPGVEYN